MSSLWTGFCQRFVEQITDTSVGVHVEVFPGSPGQDSLSFRRAELFKPSLGVSGGAVHHRERGFWAYFTLLREGGTRVVRT